MDIVSRFFSGKGRPRYAEKKKSIVIFVTGGEDEADDEKRAIRVLSESQARGDNVYFLFIGACEHNVEFAFLKKIAACFENTGMVIILDLAGSWNCWRTMRSARNCWGRS